MVPKIMRDVKRNYRVERELDRQFVVTRRRWSASTLEDLGLQDS
jgi:hypothetical protein